MRPHKLRAISVDEGGGGGWERDSEGGSLGDINLHITENVCNLFCKIFAIKEAKLLSLF